MVEVDNPIMEKLWSIEDNRVIRFDGTLVKACASLEEAEVKLTELEQGLASIDRVLAGSYNTQERRDLAKKGQALPDGSFPIVNVQDLKDAIKLAGRGKDPEKARAFIKKRAKELNSEGLIPDTW